MSEYVGYSTDQRYAIIDALVDIHLEGSIADRNTRVYTAIHRGLPGGTYINVALPRNYDEFNQHADMLVVMDVAAEAIADIIKSSELESKVSTMTTFPKPKDIHCNQTGIFKMTKIEELFDAEFPNIKAAKFFDDDSRRVALRIWVADEVRKAGWTSYRIDTSYGGLVLDYTIPAATEPSFAEAPKAEPEVPTAPKSRFTFKRVLAGVVTTAAVVTTVVVVVNKLRG